MLDGVDGQWADKATFLSSAPEIARVSSTGVVTAVAPGVAEITTSLTVANRNAAGSMTAMVDSLATSVVLTANQDQSWSPFYVNVKAGGIVTWIVPEGVRVGTIWLNVSGPNPEKLEFTNGVATRTFSTPGIYDYGTDGDFMWSGEGGVVQIH